MKRLALCIAALCATLLSGCTSLREYVHNGFQVGPNYHKPPALVADHWIDANDKRLRNENDNLCTWWQVMNDPVLNQMMIDAYQQNLTLREAGWRVLQARAQLGIAVGNFFPQQQNANGNYRRIATGQNYSSIWNFNFNLAWELDFWGRFRRAIQSAEDTLDASVFNYDDVLVTLLGDIADNYVQVRTNQERIRLLENTVKIQQDVYNFIDVRLREGFGTITTLDQAQAESDLKQSQAQLANLRIAVRLAENRLCVLMGIPPIDLENLLKSTPDLGIPKVPNYLVVGMPADLLRRRPDVRRAERDAAAQAEFIGIAEADLYPAFTINGTLGWQAQRFSDLFSPQAFRGSVGPSFNWNLLNYGRIINNVRFQDAGFQALVAVYQNTVLLADEEVENGIITFLEAQERARLLQESVEAANRALAVIVGQYEQGAGRGVGDFNRYALITQTLIQQQDQWAQSRGQVNQGLIQVYRALGGGWQIRLQPDPNELRFLPPVDGAPGLLPEQIAPPVPGENLPAPNEPALNQPVTLLAPEKVVPATAVSPQTLTASPGNTPLKVDALSSTAVNALVTPPASSNTGAVPNAAQTTVTTASAATASAATASAATANAPQASPVAAPNAGVVVLPAMSGPMPAPINMLRPIQLTIVNDGAGAMKNSAPLATPTTPAQVQAPTMSAKMEPTASWPAPQPTGNVAK